MLNVHMKKDEGMLRMFFNLLILLLFVSCATYADTDFEEESGHEDQKSYLLYDDIYLISDKKEEWGQRPKYYMNAIFPVLDTQDDNETVKNFNDLIADFIKSERADFKSEIEKNSAAQATMPVKLRKNNLYIDYSSTFVRSKKNRVLSIRFSMQRFMGGMAHPALTHHTINYDFTNDAVLELSSLFKSDSNYLEVLSGIVSDSLAKKLKNAFDKQGALPNEDNFKHWNLKSDGILFTFEEGQVAPRVYGAQTVLVPYKAIPGLFAEDAIIAHCANRKAHCLSSSLVTGGFLDEASLSTSSTHKKALQSSAAV